MDIVERLRDIYVQNGTNYVQQAAAEIERLRAERDALKRDAERYRTALEQIVAPFEDLNFVSGNKLLTYIHDTATSALAADGVAEDV